MSISRDTHDDGKNYKKVIFQVGIPVVDNELNEAQDNLLTEVVEGIAATQSVLRAVDPTGGANGGLRYGYARGSDWLCQGASIAADINVVAGALHVDGFRIRLEANQSLVSAGVAFPATVVSDTYGFIYADFVITEIDATEDPNIAQSLLGETTRREKLSVTFGKTESTTSFEDAFTALTGVPISSEPAIWKNNTARVFLCRYKRPAASGNIVSSYIVDLRQPVPAERIIRHPFIKTIRSHTSVATEGAATSDGMIVWDLTNSKLQIGVANGAATDNAIETGALMTISGAPDHYLAQTTNYVWAATGAGNADGTPRVPDSTKGWSIPDGSALGYWSQGTSGNRRSSALMKKHELNDSPRMAVYEFGASNPVAYTPNQLTVEHLEVATLDNFISDSGSFIIVTRKGSDLIWFDGTVTRGQTGRLVFEELGGTPSEWTAVVGTEGKNHIGLVDGVERALNYSALSAGTGTLGTGRTVRLFVKRGQWEFARGIHKYGTAAEISGQGEVYDTSNSQITIKGEGPGLSKLLFRNPETAARADADLSVVEFIANTIVVKGVTFDQDFDDTFRGSYYHFEGYSVELRNCHFKGPVRILANRVTVKDCKFFPLENEADLFPTTVTGGFAIPQHLAVYPKDSTLTSIWEVSKNHFLVGLCPGAQASFVPGIVGIQNLVTANISGNIWEYNDDGFVAAIHFPGFAGAQASSGTVKIKDNRFIGACGVVKVGNVTGDTVPFNGNYHGCPLMDDQEDLRTTALGYISMTSGRGRASQTLIKGNYFDFSKVGSGLIGRFVMWGACMGVVNYLTNNESASAIYANIRYQDNHHVMRSDTPWGSAGADPQIATWGFWISPTFQDGLALNDLIVENVDVVGNSFDIGGESTSPTSTWRSINCANITSWPVSGGFLTDATALIGIQLKNVVVAGSSHTGRLAKGIRISGNKILQRRTTGQVLPEYDVITLDDSAAHPRWWFHGILLDGAVGAIGILAGVMQESATDFYMGNMASPTSGGGFEAPIVENNRIEASIFDGNITTTNGFSAILIGAAYQAKVANNSIYLSRAAENNGIELLGSKRSLVLGNTIKAYYGIRGSASDYAAGNLLHTTGSTAIVGPDEEFDASTENFKT